MTGRIIIKTVHGRKYRYERISTKRVDGKVVTKDHYLGPVTPAKRGRKSKMAGVPESIKQSIRTKYSVGNSFKSMMQYLRDHGHQISESTLRNWLKDQEKRSDITEIREFAAAEGGTAAARRRGWGTRRKRVGEAKAKREGAQERERRQEEEAKEVLQAQLKREAEEATKWRQEAGEWQQRFRTIKR